MEERLEILKRVESGEIDAEAAAALLSALDEPATEAVEAPVPPFEPLPRGERWPGSVGPEERTEQSWARFWIYPLMAGGIVLILGALIMGLVSATGAARGWLLCGWLPMILGLVVVLLAFWSRQATWLHVRISEDGKTEDGEAERTKGGKRKIAFSFPLPLTLAAWGVRIAQPFVPQLKETGVDDLIIALRESSAQGAAAFGGRGEPFFIDVQAVGDREDGERVQLYIG